MARIPEYILEAINCGELKACDYYEQYGKENIEQALEALKNSDNEILSQIDAGKLYDAVKNRKESISDGKIDRRVEGKTQIKHFNFGAIKPVAAAAVFLLLILPGVMRIHQRSASLDSSGLTDFSVSETAVRTKGNSTGPQLFLYQQKQDVVISLHNGTKVEAGDLIQLAYNPNGNRYGLIFSIDGNHNITNHFGSDDFDAWEMDNSVTYLDYSYELDDAPEYEIFVMIASDEPFNFRNEAEIMKNKNLKYLKSGTYVHDRYEYTTFVLIK